MGLNFWEYFLCHGRQIHGLMHMKKLRNFLNSKRACIWRNRCDKWCKYTWWLLNLLWRSSLNFWETFFSFSRHRSMGKYTKKIEKIARFLKKGPQMQYWRERNGISIHDGFLAQYSGPNKFFEKKLFECFRRQINRH